MKAWKRCWLMLVGLFMTCAAMAQTPVAPTPPTALESAWREIRLQNWKGAKALFEKELKQTVTNSDEFDQCKLGIALCLHHIQPDTESDKQEAGKLYDELIERTAGKPIQVLAMLYRARLADQIDYYEDEPDLETALKLYDQILENFPDSPYIHHAALYKAQLAVNKMTRESSTEGIAQIDAWLSKYPDNLFRSIFLSLKGQALVYPMEDYKAAAATFAAIEKDGKLPGHVQPDAHLWRIANLAQKAGDTEMAIAYYTRLIKEVERSGYGFESYVRLKELGVENPPEVIDPFADTPVDDSASMDTPEEKGADQ